MEHTVRWRADEDDPEGKDGHVLLELEVAVHGHKGIVVAGHEAQEVAILDARPSTADDRLDVMTVKQSGEIYRELFVKKDAHQPGASRGRGRARRWPARA